MTPTKKKTGNFQLLTKDWMLLKCSGPPLGFLMQFIQVTVKSFYTCLVWPCLFQTVPFVTRSSSFLKSHI